MDNEDRASHYNQFSTFRLQRIHVHEWTTIDGSIKTTIDVLIDAHDVTEPSTTWLTLQFLRS